jgi:hypothetical protein
MYKMITLKHGTSISWIIFLILPFLLSGCNDKDWQSQFSEQLSLLGHRNWIIVADYAYPLQSAPGIQTIYTGDDHLEVLQTVLQEIDTAPHIKANILLDAELDMVSSEAAPGIEKFKSNLQGVLKGRHITTLAHEEIISKLDKTSQLFSVLILKTDMILPYTSIFLELDCAYWDAEKEQKMRDLIGGN